MKNKITLKEFLYSIKQELLDASNNATGPVAFEMTEVEVEVEFGLDTSAKANGSVTFFVNVGGSAQASLSQTHRVRVKMIPLKPESSLPGQVKHISHGDTNGIIPIAEDIQIYDMSHGATHHDPKFPLFKNHETTISADIESPDNSTCRN